MSNQTTKKGAAKNRKKEQQTKRIQRLTDAANTAGATADQLNYELESLWMGGAL
jgi:hypothetical protein